MPTNRFDGFLDYHRNIKLLSEIESVLGWDKRTQLPAGASTRRGEQAAFVVSQIHALRIDSDYQDLLEALKGDGTLSFNQGAAVREELRLSRRSAALPSALVEELEMQKAKAYSSWIAARKDKNFKIFIPDLERMVELKKQVGDCLIEGEQTSYEGLLSEFDPYVSQANYEATFKKLKTELVPLVQAWIENTKKTPQVKTPVVSAQDQEAFNRWVLEKMGYDFNRGRLDIAAHPFCTNLGNEVRITTRYNVNNYRQSLYGCLHEMGHSFYEFGMMDLNPLGPLRECSGLGMHESQSRFWENQVGRSPAFADFLVKNAPERFRNIVGTDADAFFKQVNRAEPTFIRVEADEATYNLHILVRFEIEMGLFRGDYKVSDLEEVWNQQFEKLLGIKVLSPDQGVLQDIHWASGLFGYFPTYTFGNLIAAQLQEKMVTEFSLDDLVRKGHFKTILEWLNQNIHRHGRAIPTLDLVFKATGSELTHEPFIRYLKRKFEGQS
jgi:carboxypeptidase Taq